MLKNILHRLRVIPTPNDNLKELGKQFMIISRDKEPIYCSEAYNEILKVSLQ